MRSVWVHNISQIVYIQACIYIYTHPYKRTCIHTHIHTYLHTYIPTYLHTFVPTYLHTLHTWGLGITMHSWARSPEFAMEHWILLLLCRFKPHVGSFTSKIPRLSFYVFKYPQEQLLKTPTARNNPKVSASAAKALSRQSLQTLPTLATLNKHPHSIAALAQDIARIPNPTSPSSSRICLAVMLCPARAQALMAAPQATTYGCKASSPDMCTIHKQIYIYIKRERERDKERGERERASILLRTAGFSGLCRDLATFPSAVSFRHSALGVPDV